MQDERIWAKWSCEIIIQLLEIILCNGGLVGRWLGGTITCRLHDDTIQYFGCSLEWCVFEGIHFAVVLVQSSVNSTSETLQTAFGIGILYSYHTKKKQKIKYKNGLLGLTLWTNQGTPRRTEHDRRMPGIRLMWTEQVDPLLISDNKTWTDDRISGSRTQNYRTG